MNLQDLPDHSRVWVFAASRPLSASESETLLTSVDRHVAGWLAHGHPVVGAWEWRFNQFLLVAADETATGVSGCSIDGLFRVLKQAEADLGVELLAAGRVWFRDEAGEIRSASRPEFRRLAEAGTVGPDTPVFDNTVATLGDVRDGRWERPLRESWHGRAFPVTV